MIAIPLGKKCSIIYNVLTGKNVNLDFELTALESSHLELQNVLQQGIYGREVCGRQLAVQKEAAGL